MGDREDLLAALAEAVDEWTDALGELLAAAEPDWSRVVDLLAQRRSLWEAAIEQIGHEDAWQVLATLFQRLHLLRTVGTLC